MLSIVCSIHVWVGELYALLMDKLLMDNFVINYHKIIRVLWIEPFIGTRTQHLSHVFPLRYAHILNAVHGYFLSLSLGRASCHHRRRGRPPMSFVHTNYF